MMRRHHVLQMLVVLCAVGAVHAQQPDAAQIAQERRQAERDVPKLVEVLELKPGMTAADVGSGFGTMTVVLGHWIGSGRVFATDITEHALRQTREYAVLAVIDGNPGLSSGLRSVWPGIVIQRCTAHKLRNLQAKAPARLREELTEDYRRMIYADTVSAVEQQRARFTKKWQLRCPAVVESLKDAGDEPFTFLRFPGSQWKALRTTNALERINEEFRRRTKTQASLPGQDAVLRLLFGLLRTGQVKLRALVGYQNMGQVNKAA